MDYNGWFTLLSGYQASKPTPPIMRFKRAIVARLLLVCGGLVFGLLPLVPWFIRLGWSPLKTKRPGMIVFRGVLNLVCMLAFSWRWR